MGSFRSCPRLARIPLIAISGAGLCVGSCDDSEPVPVTLSSGGSGGEDASNGDAGTDAAGSDGGGVGGDGGLSSGGTAGTPAGGGSAGAGSQAGAAGGAGQAGDAGTDAPASLFCGDAIRDPLFEECDDAPGMQEDACTDSCRAHNFFVVAPQSLDAGPKLGSRSLGLGARPAAAGASGSAVAFIEKSASAHILRVAFFELLGGRNGPPIEAGVDAAPSEQANAVMAALPGGTFAIAWNDLHGGTLDVALRIVQPGATPGAVVTANQTIAGAQQDPDLAWTGTELVVGWTDSLAPKLRRFDSTLTPLDGELQLDVSSGLGGSVTVAPFTGSWAAAWRAIEPSGLETIRVRTPSTQWNTVEFPPGASAERPALLTLDATHLLAVFSEATDPQTTGTSNVFRLRAAILDTSAPGTVALAALPVALHPWASDATLSQRRPSLARSGNRFYLAWQSESPVGDPLSDEIWVRELGWDGATLTLFDEIPLQADAPRNAAQRAPVLAASPLGPEGALLTVWEEFTFAPLHPMLPDLVFGLRPTPFVILPPPGDGGG